jgi:hypothetical protein
MKEAFIWDMYPAINTDKYRRYHFCRYDAYDLLSKRVSIFDIRLTYN